MKFKRKHLSDEEIALYAEALKFDATKQLDDYLINHIEECGDCQLKVSEIYELIKDDNNIKFEKSRFAHKKVDLLTNNMTNLKRYIVAASILIFMLFIFISTELFLTI